MTDNAEYTANFAIQNYTITVNANNNYGTVSGGGTYAYGSTATLTATANEGYHFVEWNDHNTDSPRSITVTGNATYTATFAINSYTITVQPNNADFGITTGSGTYTHGQTVTATATANEGYVFNGWSDGATETPHTFTATQDLTLIANFSEENYDPVFYTVTVQSANNTMGSATGGGVYEEHQSLQISATANIGYSFVRWNDNNTDNTRTITVTGDVTYTAYFEANTYSITAVPDDEAHGSTSGTGLYDYGTTVTISATPSEGYHFIQWNDGNTQNPRVVTVTGNMEYTASFAASTYVVNVVANNAMYGTTTGSGLYTYGQSISISAIPNAGYHFVQWNDGSAQNVRTVIVTGSITYTAMFTGETYQLTVVPDDDSHGTTIPNGTNNYAYGEQVTISAMANNGYRFTQWNDGNTYPMRTVTVSSNATYTANFEAIQYTVTATPNNVICGATTGSGVYNYMDEVSLIATPNEGYRFDRWSDGSTDNPYVFNVTQNVTVMAVFVSENSGQGGEGDDSEGIDEVEKVNVRIYPNPTSGIVNVKWDGEQTMPMQVYNIYGQLLQEVPSGENVIDVSSYAKGTYILRIGEATMKIVKY